MKKFFARNWFYILIFISFCFPVLLLSNQNSCKALIITVLLLLWFFLGIRFKDFTKSSILFIFLVLPFNISIQIPESVQIFGNNIALSFPFVSGVQVNYLVPTFHIADIFVSIFLLQLFYSEKKYFFSIVKNRFLLIFVFFLIFQNIYEQEILVLINSVRIYLYTSAAYGIKVYFTGEMCFRDLLSKSYIIVIVITSVLIQGFIGLYQFIRGCSLGLYILGESHIANGMSGSSFIDINGESFLRAYGTFPHPNVFAGWLILMFVFSWIYYKESKTRLLPLLSMVLILLISLLTFSRVSILILVLLSIALSLSERLTKRSLYSISSILFIRFLNLFDGGDSSLIDRIRLIVVNWKNFKQNFLIGTGLGNSVRYYIENIPYTSGGKLLLQPVHNIFLLSFVELGLFGGLYYWYMQYVLFLRGVRWNIFKVAILVSLVIIGLFDHYLFSLPQGLLIFYLFLLGIAY